MRRLQHSLLWILASAMLACGQDTQSSSASTGVGATTGGERSVDAEESGPRASGRDFVERVDVGGYSLFIACWGTGRPTVVLETGFTDPGITWGRGLMRRVSDVSRVCVYDRAGLGYSDPRPAAAGAAHSGKVAAELHALLAGAGVEPPYVLVGHSVGGMHSRVFTYDHPEEVVGMVLVDSSHPDQFLRARERLDAEDWASMERSVRSAHADPAKEPTDWEQSSLLARQTGNLDSRPLQVLSHDPAAQSPCESSDCLSAAGNVIWENLWQELQVELASLSLASTHTVIPGSGHYLQAQHPDRVVEAIREVVGRVRQTMPPSAAPGT